MQLAITPAKKATLIIGGGRRVILPTPRVVADSTIRRANYPADDPHHEPVLRELIESWVESDCRYDRWRNANPEEALILGREANRWTLTFADGAKGKPLPVLSDHPYVGERKPKRERINVFEYTGYEAFVTFLVCAAPGCPVGKCDRCQKFFWNRWGHLNKRFCSRKCAQYQTASEGQARKVARQRRERNRKIKEAVRNFISENLKGDWKRSVAKSAGVTLHYLTRALKRGLGGEPDGLKLPKWQLEYLHRSEKKGE